MKKPVMLICYGLTGLCYSQSQCYYLIENDYASLKSEYSVKKVEVKETDHRFSEDTINHYWTKCYDCNNFSYDLDTQKQIISVQSYDHEGSPSYQRINYFENGNCIKSMDKFNDSTCNKSRIIKFNSDGRPSQVELRSNDNSLEKVVTYDYKDSSFLKVTFSNPKLINVRFTEFGHQGKQILVKKAIRRVYRKYKGDQLIIREIEQGKATFTSTAKYKKNGKVWLCYSSKSILSGSKSFYKYSYSRNDSISNSSYQNKDRSSETITRYDSMNNTVFQEVAVIKGKDEGSKTTRTWEFTYDSRGNWTKKTEYKNGELQTTIERQIIYYE